MSSRSSGFSLFELLIAVAVIGLISAFAVPAYRSYIDTANMTKVTANFQQGVRLAQTLFTQHRSRVALGLTGTVPTKTADWIELLNQSGVGAPGGGLAYIKSNNRRNGGRGDAVTGAVGVQWRKKREELRLWRPKYSSLTGQRATISQYEIDVITQN